MSGHKRSYESLVNASAIGQDALDLRKEDSCSGAGHRRYRRDCLDERSYKHRCRDERYQDEKCSPGESRHREERGHPSERSHRGEEMHPKEGRHREERRQRDERTNREQGRQRDGASCSKERRFSGSRDHNLDSGFVLEPVRSPRRTANDFYQSPTLLGTEARTTSASANGVSFVDDNEPFVWKKRDKMLQKQGITVSTEYQTRKRAAMAAELESAKARREERQRERDSVEFERAQAARMREQELNADWDRMEDTFSGQQHFLRQAIRLRQNRPTLADQMARNVRLDLLELEPDTCSPCQLLDGMRSELSYDSLRKLRDSIQLELDYIPDFSRDDDTEVYNKSLRLEWWTCLDTFVSDMLCWADTVAVRSGDRTLSGSGSGNGRRSIVHPSIQKDLDSMFNGKSYEQLIAMEKDIAQRNGGDGNGGDENSQNLFAEVDFWQAALGRIRRGMAAYRIDHLNTILGNERRALLAAMPPDDEKREDSENVVKGEEEGPVAIDEEAMVRAEAAKGMKQNEEIFDDVIQERSRRVYQQGYAWNDKYRPRRPRYFNRVHTGYDWNKYNRTHYDHDNPPPKTVQGYKFNIFYPDLIDRSKAPTFTVSRTDNPEVCILTFKAGPPYEDLAFKIVNRPWEHSHRRGFRCTFDRGILHLWFNFRRLRYRR